MATVFTPDKLKFTDEPPPKGVPGRKSTLDPYEKVLAVLHQHPGKWSMIATGEKAHMVQRLRTAFPDYEFASRAENNNVPFAKSPMSIWACFRGTEYFLQKAEQHRQRTASASSSSVGGSV